MGTALPERLTDAPPCLPPQAASRRPGFLLPAGACDTHVHVVGPTDIYPLGAPRNYTPVPCSLAQYQQVMAVCGIARAVLVQPSFYGTDNSALLDALRAGGSAFRGVVVPEPRVSDAEIAAMHTLGVRGLRLNLVNPQILALDDTLALCARVAAHGWHLQVQMRADDEGTAVLEALAARTGVTLVIDHLGRPPSLRPPSALLRLLESGRAYVKLSAPYRLAAPPYDPLQALVSAYAAANPERLLWASDWPHTELFDTAPPDDADLVDLLAEWLPSAELRQRVCTDNPARLYGFQTHPPH